ncbi:hypothetical protein MMC16_007904 [Acarospora aff. strigata]|nr:hypothetical protein [Acarospora aff. strigata]
MSDDSESDLSSNCDVSTDDISRSLGKAASDVEVQVHCGGDLPLGKIAKLFAGSQEFVFPLSDEDLKHLKLLSAPASFGKGKQETLDPEYRQALKLVADSVACNFDLSNWSVLAQIKQVLLPHSNKEVLAQLDKVNLYTVGGFFKPHKDTPRSSAMFGSLVLCLPSPFEGGQLVIRHKSGQKVYDWGAAEQDSQKVQWAAFYSDCTHEILPVTEGVRVTVTYNLYVDDMTAREHLSTVTTKFSDDLANALKQPEFLSEGSILGFACEHAYPRDEKVAGVDTALKITSCC